MGRSGVPARRRCGSPAPSGRRAGPRSSAGAFRVYLRYLRRRETYGRRRRRRLCQGGRRRCATRGALARPHARRDQRGGRPLSRAAAGFSSPRVRAPNPLPAVICAASCFQSTRDSRPDLPAPRALAAGSQHAFSPARLPGSAPPPGRVGASRPVPRAPTPLCRRARPARVHGAPLRGCGICPADPTSAPDPVWGHGGASARVRRSAFQAPSEPRRSVIGRPPPGVTIKNVFRQCSYPRGQHLRLREPRLPGRSHGPEGALLTGGRAGRRPVPCPPRPGAVAVRCPAPACVLAEPLRGFSASSLNP